jgi:predicted N-acyltransferase
MDISWDSFAAYKKYIRKRSLKMKKNIAQEINKNRKSGVTIGRVKDIDGQERRLYKLLNENSLEYDKLPMPFQENFLSRLEKNIGDDLVIYQSIKTGRISGVMVMLKSGDTAYLYLLGIDHSLAQNDFTYFNIGFYRPIADAITDNIKKIYFGAGPYYPKLRRGCKIQKAYFFHKPCHPASKLAAKLWFCLHHYWYNKKLPQSYDSA